MTHNDTIYLESFFRGQPFYNDTLSPERLGEQGVLVDYSLVNDSLVALGLIFGLLLSLLFIKKSRHLIRFQSKNIFRMPRENSIEMRETSNEMQYQTYFCVQGMLLLGLIAYSVTSTAMGQQYECSPYKVWGYMSAAFAIYYIVHEMLVRLVHYVFFDEQSRHLGNISRLYFMAMYGAALLPVVMLHIYLQLSPWTTIYIVGAICGAMLLLHIYKSWNIFFQKKNAVIQFFLYLCTLEVVPLALLGGTLIFIANYLKTNI